MESTLARNIFSRLIQNSKKPDSGPVTLTPDDAKNLRDVASEIIRRDNEGIRSHWGPRLADLNTMCGIILTDKQMEKKGQRKVEVARAIFEAVSQARWN